MIFATCGSTDFPFERMMDALTTLPAERLDVQHGPCTPPPCARAQAYLPFKEVVQRITNADVVVTHAGVGSIICAVRAGHTPVVFPRLSRYGETVDDHQAELANALAARGTVIVAWTPAELRGAVASVPPRRGDTRSGRRGLAAAVHAAIRGEPLDVVARPASARG